MRPDIVQVAVLGLALGSVAVVALLPQALRRRNERRRRSAGAGTKPGAGSATADPVERMRVARHGKRRAG